MLILLWFWKNDAHAYCSVMGDPMSIWQTWFQLKDNPSIEKIIIRDAVAGHQVDPSQGYASMITNTVEPCKLP